MITLRGEDEIVSEATLFLEDDSIKISDTIDLIRIESYMKEDWTVYMRFMLLCDNKTFYIAVNQEELKGCKSIKEMVLRALGDKHVD